MVILNGNYTVKSNILIHHNNIKNKLIYKDKGIRVTNHYGVSSGKNLSPSLFTKRYDQIWQCLVSLGFTIAQREVILRLLRFYAYYDEVYPKESQITSNSGCSKATFWRTIGKLKEMGLLLVINRFIRGKGEKSQISNLYCLDKLVLLIVRYLAEHGLKFQEKWLQPFLKLSGKAFWQNVWSWSFELCHPLSYPHIPVRL